MLFVVGTETYNVFLSVALSSIPAFLQASNKASVLFFGVLMLYRRCRRTGTVSDTVSVSPGLLGFHSGEAGDVVPVSAFQLKASPIVYCIIIIIIIIIIITVFLGGEVKYKF